MTSPKGWRKEPARHALAARGVKTTATEQRNPLPGRGAGFDHHEIDVSMEAAQLFEFNTNYDQWMKLWQEVGGEKTLGQHMWHKFQDGGLLNAYGHADFATASIMSKMILKRAEEENPHIFKRYLNVP